MRGSRTITSAMPAALRTATSISRKCSPARRNGVRGVASSPAASTPSPLATAAVVSARPPRRINGIERQYGVGPARKRRADIDPARHRGKRDRTIGPGIRDRVRHDGITVAQRHCPRRERGRRDILGQYSATRQREGALSRRDRTDALLDQRENGAERRQARNALVSGILDHRRYDKEVRCASTTRDEMTEKTLNLRGLKCPLPALRTRKALSQAAPGDILVVECTDPLTSIDIPNLLNQTGDTLEDTRKDKKLLTFRIRKK